MAGMSNESPTSSVDKPTDAASPNASEQVTIPGTETKGLLDAVDVLKEQLRAEFNVSLSAEDLVEDNKLCVCFKELEEKIKVIISCTETQQETEANSVVDDVLTQHDKQNKQLERVNVLEDELSKTEEELKKTKDELERERSKWKDKENNLKTKITKRDEQIEIQSKLLNEKGDDIQKLNNEMEARDKKIRNLEEKIRTVEAELGQAMEDPRKGNDRQKLINQIEAKDKIIQHLKETAETKLEHAQAKEDAKRITEEAERTLKAKIQTLEQQLSNLEIESDRNLWKGKCEGLLHTTPSATQCFAIAHDAIRLATYVSNPENRQPSCDDASVSTREPTSRSSPDLDPYEQNTSD